MKDQSQKSECCKWHDPLCHQAQCCMKCPTTHQGQPSQKETEGCRNGKNCPWCLLDTGKFERCEKEILREVKRLYRPNTYWIRKEVDGYVLTVFHGRFSKMYSDSWNINPENLKEVVQYLEENKVDRGDDSLTINDL